MLWVRRYLDHRVCTGPHQQIVNLPFVLVRNIRDLLGQGEDKVEIPHRQQLGLSCSQPGFGSTGLTLRTVTITARVVGDVLVRTVVAPRNMTAKRCRPAALNGTHYLKLVQVDVPGIGCTPSSTMVAEDIRNL
jgi:hypothetical protein